MTDKQQEIFNWLQQYVTAKTDFKGNLTLETDLKEVAPDSLDIVEMQIDMEGRFNIALRDDFFAGLKTVGEVVDKLALALDKK